ncbi:NADH-quinone oxidoreductase subunit F [Halocalculus aciditolerans]|uniref:NADH dehydrogenase n=1 Tax=Halocalculus aciditolerans TaxID=1383812 RepID=A0A830F4A6_9EURY|nr:NADH-quinone oxidoreductase subunit F [Halocalculus aciditolerans]GGL61331.1 NADH dehydrogenase [Halocalculus aciditolerans]
MTKRPRFADDVHWAPGLVAVALFAVFAAVFLTQGFAPAAGFSPDVALTESIGYLLFDMPGQAAVDGTGFLAAFEMIDFFLVGALVAAVLLARRESDGAPLEKSGGER